MFYEICPRFLMDSLGELQYGYDDINRLIAVSRPRKSTTFSYDNNNNRVQASSSDTDGTSVLSSISYTYGYDDDNRITAKTKKINGVNYEQTSYGYDPNSNLTHLGVTIKKGVPPTPVNAGTLSLAFDYEYDDLDRQSSVKNSKNDTYNATYDAVGNMTNIHYPDNTNSARAFDNEDRITQVTNDHPIATQPHIVYTYAFDLLGNCTSFEKNPSIPYTGGAKAYSYDKLNRLTYDEAEQMKFVYDTAGNKTRDNLLSTRKHIDYSYNQAHQLLSRVPGTGLGLPSYAYEYDANGNQSRKNETASGKDAVPANAAGVKKAAARDTGSDGTDPLGVSTLDQSIVLSAKGLTRDNRLNFTALFKDSAGNPLYTKKSEITAYYDGKEIPLFPRPPASDQAVEAENLIALKGGHPELARFDAWAYLTPKDPAPGVHTFAITVRSGGRDYTNTVSSTVPEAAARRRTASRDTDTYNGPPSQYYATRVASLSLSSTTVEPGGTITAHVNMLDSFWASYCYISCSYCDPDSIKVDGVPVPRSAVTPGHCAYYPRYSLPQAQPVPDPSYYVRIDGLGTHVVEFKLDPAFNSKYFTYNAQDYSGAGSWSGPFVCIGVGWWAWDADEGFVITNATGTLAIEEEQVIPDVIAPGETAEFTAGLLTSGFTPGTLSWLISVAGPDGVDLVTYAGTGDSIVQAIDGLDAHGNPLPAGHCTINSSATDHNGHDATGDPLTFNVLPDPPEIKDTRSTFDAANRLRRVQSYGIVSSQPWLVSDERFSYDPDDELFFSEQRKPFNPQDVSMPPDGTSYRFVNLLHGYEGGLLLYTNKTSGSVRESTLTTTSLAHVIEYYTYLNGVKVGITSVPGKGTGTNYYCSYDGQGNVEHVSNRAGTAPYEMYKYTAYGECSSYEGNAGAAMSAYKGYDKGPFGNKCGVRHYDSESGRFVSPDPFKGTLGDPQSQHPYMYCRGNPLKYSDPNGLTEQAIGPNGNVKTWSNPMRFRPPSDTRLSGNRKKVADAAVKVLDDIHDKRFAPKWLCDDWRDFFVRNIDRDIPGGGKEHKIFARDPVMQELKSKIEEMSGVKISQITPYAGFLPYKGDDTNQYAKGHSYVYLEIPVPGDRSVWILTESNGSANPCAGDGCRGFVQKPLGRGYLSDPVQGPDRSDLPYFK